MGFKEWLEISRDRSYPRSVADILDYATERYHENCGKTVLCSLQAALSVIEIVGRVPESQMFSHNATWMAHIKSMTADLVATSPPEAPASMFPVAVLVALEIFICREGYPRYLRALGFVQLVMIWRSLRADDAQGLLPASMRLDDAGFLMNLERSKTTGPDRRTRMVKVFIERSISLTGFDWLAEGVSLWNTFAFARDYLVMKSSADFSEPLERGVDASTVALYMRKVLSNLDTPKRDGQKWRATGSSSCHFCGHSARNFLASVGAALGIPKERLDFLGRWKIAGEGAASYIRTASTKSNFQLQRPS